MKIQTGIANEISKNIAPPHITYDTPLHFAIDNADFYNDIPDGKSEFHDLEQVVFQKLKAKKEINKIKFTIEPANKMHLTKKF